MSARDRLRQLATTLTGLLAPPKAGPANVLSDLRRSRDELLQVRAQAEAMLAESSGETADRLAAAVQQTEQKLSEVQLHIGRLERIAARTARAQAIKARVRELSEAFSTADEGRRQQIHTEIEGLQHELAALQRDGEAERVLVQGSEDP